MLTVLVTAFSGCTQSFPEGPHLDLLILSRLSLNLTSDVDTTDTDSDSTSNTAVPASGATSVSFTGDTDNTADELGGDIEITKSDDESDIDSYVIYWGSDSTTKLSGEVAITEITATGSDLAFTLPGDQAIPSNSASHFLVYSKNSAGENETPTGVPFTDVRRHWIFITSATYTGKLEGITDPGGADDECESVKGAVLAGHSTEDITGSTYKAFLVDGSTRIACTASNCSGETEPNSTWVLKANTYYYPAGAYTSFDSATEIVKTNDAGIFDFTDMVTSIDPVNGYPYYTGIDSNWISSSNDCDDWTDELGSFAEIGNGSVQTSFSITTGGIGIDLCSGSNRFLCVQQ